MQMQVNLNQPMVFLRHKPEVSLKHLLMRKMMTQLMGLRELLLKLTILSQPMVFGFLDASTGGFVETPFGEDGDDRN